MLRVLRLYLKVAIFQPELREHAPRTTFVLKSCGFQQLASGCRRVSRQSGSPVVPAEYPARAARQWIPPSIRQSGSSVDPAEYPARAPRQWIPPSIPPEQLASGSCPVSHELLASGSRPVSRERLTKHPAEHPRVARQWILPSIPPE